MKMYEKRIMDDEVNYRLRLPFLPGYALMDWSPKQIRGCLEDIVKDAAADVKRRPLNNRKLSGLISQEYADKHEPINGHYTIGVGTEKEKIMLEKVLSKLENEKAKDSRHKCAAKIILGTSVVVGTVAVGAAAAYAAAAGAANDAGVAILAGWPALAVFSYGAVGIYDHFYERLDKKKGLIGEKYNRLEIKVDPAHGQSRYVSNPSLKDKIN